MRQWPHRPAARCPRLGEPPAGHRAGVGLCPRPS